MIKFATILLLFAQVAIAQEFFYQKITIGNETKEVLSLKHKELIYLSSKDLADKFSINYFFNPSNKKAELKFSEYILRITANNPFIVLVKKDDNSVNAVQIPVNTFYKESIFLPVRYSQKILTTCFGKEVNIKGISSEIVKEINVEKKDTLIKTQNGITPKFNLSEKANGTLLTIKLSSPVKSVNHSLLKDTIIIVFPRTNFNNTANTTTLSKGLVKNIFLSNAGDDAFIKIPLTKDFTSYEVINSENGNEILVTIHSKKFANTILDSKKEKWNFDVIVIDAGHGGKDYGAIGVNGAVEKEINLAIALKLGSLISENFPEIKVVYTRKDDRFIELYRRGKIANENNGKLFISIHCNSQPQKPGPASGFEVYLLRPGRTEDAIQIANQENKVIEFEDNPSRYQKLTDENFILVSMAHSSYMKYSEKFAELLHQQVNDKLKIKSRGVKQAGFYVLVGASMPSVLIETAFISNSNDANYLKSKEGQEEMARAIFSAIKSFKTYYDKVIETE